MGARGNHRSLHHPAHHVVSGPRQGRPLVACTHAQSQTRLLAPPAVVVETDGPWLVAIVDGPARTDLVVDAATWLSELADLLPDDVLFRS